MRRTPLKEIKAIFIQGCQSVPSVIFTYVVDLGGQRHHSPVRPLITKEVKINQRVDTFLDTNRV
jgi:hypothetical protein